MGTVDTIHMVRKTRLVLRLTSACLLLLAGGLVASAAAAAPKVTATVTSPSPTSRLVHIVNHDRVTYREFDVETAIKPVLIRATPCGGVRRDGASNGVTFNWKYTVTCKKALPPGHAFDIHLTTSPQRGNIFVYVVVKKVRTRIG